MAKKKAGKKRTATRKKPKAMALSLAAKRAKSGRTYTTEPHPEVDNQGPAK